MQTKILNLEGKFVEDFDINESVFQEFSNILIKEVIEYHTNKRRQGTAAVKALNDMAYSTRKLFRQKGTGRARVSSKGASPNRRGGRAAFGPNGRLYSYVIPKKKIKSALRMSLGKKFQENQLILVDNMKLNEIKTKRVVEISKNLNLGYKNLFIDKEMPVNLCKSMKNIVGYDFLHLNGLNTLDLLKSEKIIITKSAWADIENRLKEEVSEK